MAKDYGATKGEICGGSRRKGHELPAAGLVPPQPGQTAVSCPECYDPATGRGTFWSDNGKLPLHFLGGA